MGGTVCQKAKGQSLADFFKIEHGGVWAAAVRATATVGGVFFAVLETYAHEFPDLTPDERGMVRYCYIASTASGRFGGGLNFSYSDQTEFGGAVEATCPDRLLDMLSPFTAQAQASGFRDGAIKWRAASRNYNAIMRALKTIGSKVALPAPLRFRDGVSEGTFTLAARNGTSMIFRRVGDGRAVRLTKYQIMDLKIAA